MPCWCRPDRKWEPSTLIFSDEPFTFDHHIYPSLGATQNDACLECYVSMFMSKVLWIDLPVTGFPGSALFRSNICPPKKSSSASIN